MDDDAERRRRRTILGVEHCWMTEEDVAAWEKIERMYGVDPDDWRPPKPPTETKPE